MVFGVGATGGANSLADVAETISHASGQFSVNGEDRVRREIPFLNDLAFVKDLALPIINGLRNALSTVKNIAEEIVPGISKVLAVMRVVSVVELPIAVHSFIGAVRDIIVEKRPEDKAIAGLTGIGNLGTMAEATGSVTVSCLAMKALKEGVQFTMPLWATVLGIVGAGLKLGALVVNVIGCVNTYRLDKAIEGKSVDEALSYFKNLDDKDVKKYFRVENPELFRKHLEVFEDRITKNQENSVIDAQALISNLRGRASDNIRNYHLKIIAHIVGIIGIAILLAVPGVMAPLGYAFLAISSGILIYQMVRNRRDVAKSYLNEVSDAAVVDINNVKVEEKEKESLFWEFVPWWIRGVISYSCSLGRKIGRLRRLVSKKDPVINDTETAVATNAMNQPVEPPHSTLRSSDALHGISDVAHANLP